VALVGDISITYARINNTQLANGCKDNTLEAAAGEARHRSCSWHSINTGLRLRW